MKWRREALLDLLPSHQGDVTSFVAITEVFTDSRKPVHSGLFVPIIGDRFDAHEFLGQAIDHGAVATLWQIDHPLPDDVAKDFPFFFVEDTVTALQQMAQHALRTIAPHVVAVTGSNGKTTTKDMMAQMLKTRFYTHKTAGNLNNHIGLPLTILAMPETCEALILEMGMNHFGEISALSKLATPDIAVITNIGESHIEFLGSREGIAQAKMEICDGLKAGGEIIYDGDEPLLSTLRRQPSVSCGFGDSNEVRITSVTETADGVRFTINDGDSAYEMPLLGQHNVKNAAFAIVVAQKLGVPNKDILVTLQSMVETTMRFEKVPGLNGSLLINDAYNASPTSMAAAIETVKQLQGFRRKILVLGDIHELGDKEKAYHEQVAQDIQPPITDVITIGERARWISDATEGDIRIVHFEEKATVVPMLAEQLTTETVVLFKASRAAGFETLVGQLQD